MANMSIATTVAHNPETNRVYIQVDQNGIIRYVGSCKDAYNRESVHKTRLNNPSASNGSKSTDYEKAAFRKAGNTLDIVIFPETFTHEEAIALETAIYELLKPTAQLFNKRSPNQTLSKWYSTTTKGFLFDQIVVSLPDFQDHYYFSHFALPVAA